MFLAGWAAILNVHVGARLQLNYTTVINLGFLYVI